MIVSNRTMRELDRRAQVEFGIPAAVLMETAGRRAWDKVRPPGRDGAIVFVCGPGNNGGDALVMARSAAEERFSAIAVVLMRERISDLAAKQLSVLRKMGVSCYSWESDQPACRDLFERAEMVVDGLFGAGLQSAVLDPAHAVIEAIDRTKGLVVSVDLPSGLHDEWEPDHPVVTADRTIVTGCMREILLVPAARRYAGQIDRVDPGFPPALIRGVPDYPEMIDRPPVIPPLLPDSHKSTRGKCIVVGGGPGTTGAPILAGLAALHSRTGMVKIVADLETTRAAVAVEPALMTASPDDALAQIDWADAVLVGPGWTEGTGGELNRLVGRASERKTPIVVDASALHRFAEICDQLPDSTNWDSIVLTPHLGEFAVLSGVDIFAVKLHLFELVRTFRQRVPATVVVKGATTVVAGRDGTVVYDGQAPYLGTAGSGDVLAGIVTALAAQGMVPETAAREAVLLHAHAGARWFGASGYGTASSLARYVGACVADYEDNA